MLGLLHKLSPRALAVLRQMVEHEHDEEGELAVCGIECWLGSERTSHAVVDQLLNCCAIRGDAIGTTTYYVANDSARHIVARPELAGEINQAIFKGENFTISQDHQVIKI